MATTQPLGLAPEEHAPEEGVAQLVGPVSDDLRAGIEKETKEIEESPQASTRSYARERREIESAGRPSAEPAR